MSGNRVVFRIDMMAFYWQLIPIEGSFAAHIGLPGRAGRRSEDRLKKAAVNY